MKFIIDAQLPHQLAKFIRDKGFDVIHTDDLPNKDRTTDREIRRIAKEQNRIVVTKDNDFWESHILKNDPQNLFFDYNWKYQKQRFTSII